MILEINDIDLQELSRQIQEGNTNGRLDSETENGGSKHISWELKMKVWEE